MEVVKREMMFTVTVGISDCIQVASDTGKPSEHGWWQDCDVGRRTEESQVHCYWGREELWGGLRLSLLAVVNFQLMYTLQWTLSIRGQDSPWKI